MPAPIDFELGPQPRNSRGWAALAASAVVHVVIILLLLFGIPSSSASSPSAAASGPTIQPVAIDQFRPPQHQARPNEPVPREQPKPPPPDKEVELGPDSKKPDAPAKEAATTAPTQAAPEPVAPPPPPTVQPPPPEPQPAAPQSVRIRGPGDYSGNRTIPLPQTSTWGPPKFDAAGGAAAAPSATEAPLGRSGLSNRDPQHWENSFDDETAGRCVEIPDLGKNADGSPVLATVIGRVLDTDGKTPMPGAHLQIVGTAFGTFSDGQGEYRLEFDPKLLGRCRKQYVQVVAPGYASQLLTLAIGPRVRSDDVVLRHGR